MCYNMPWQKVYDSWVLINMLPICENVNKMDAEFDMIYPNKTASLKH